jgi:hypothetical protein
MTTPRDDAQVVFHIAGLADVNLLPRLLEHFCLRDIVPERVSAERHGDEMRVTIAIRRDACPEWEAVARKLGQIFVVRSVLASVADEAEERQAAAG